VIAERPAGAEPSRWRLPAASTVAVVAWCLVPVALAYGTSNRFIAAVLGLAAIQSLFVASWDLVGGVSGQVSLGHAMPYGVGAYVAAVLSSLTPLAPAAALACGAITGAISGGLQAATGRHLRPVLLAIVTLAAAEVLYQYALMLQVPTPDGFLTGGEAGIPSATFSPDEIGAARFAAVVLAAGVLGLFWLTRSRLGLAMRVVRADPRGAEASGIDCARVRMLAFLISGAIAGLAGGMTAGLAGRATPPLLSLETGLFAPALAVAGGLGTIIGPATAAYLFTAAAHFADLSDSPRLALYGLILITAGLLSPAGAFCADARFRDGLRRRLFRE
jgi:ABC-type branched-subunit amino acid transport system permease subunit